MVNMLFVKNEQPFAHDKSSKIDVGDFPSRTNPVDINGKRPLLDDAEHQLFGCKRPKQVEHDTKQGSFLLNAISDKSFSALHDDDSQGREVDSLPEKFAAKVTSSHWYEGSDSDEEDCLDSLNSSLQENPLLSYVDGYQGLSGYNQLEEFYEPFYDRSPVRPVATGPNNQAEIPEWRSNSYRSANKFLNDNASAINSADLLHDDEDDSDKWLGTCIIPMPDSALLASDVTVLQGKTECSCFDKGSIRCVRQHVLEAREGLRKSLGQDKFMNLGFTNMGEYIAEEWTEEEERMFHEVILSNPASLGKNFWDVLSQVFPTRTTKDIVSYYFNVFMLRKRAAQNRSVPLNADSDNDECEEYEDSAYAFEEEEEDEDEDEDEDDSAIESLEDQGNSTDDKDDEEEFDGDECDGYSGAENGDFCSAYEPFSASKSNFLPSLQLIDRNLDNCTYEHDVQDDSCTSYEGQIHAPDSLCAPVDIMDTRHSLIEDHELREYKNYNLGGDHELFDGHCDPKAWDLAFTCGATKPMELLHRYPAGTPIFTRPSVLQKKQVQCLCHREVESRVCERDSGGVVRGRRAALVILSLASPSLLVTSSASGKAKSRINNPYDEKRLLEQNKKIQEANNAPIDFPNFIREGFEVKVVTSESYVKSESGLIYLDIEVGNGDCPTDGQQVTFHYIGYNESGRRIDSSYLQGSPAKIRLGNKALVPGFEEGIRNMKPGGKRRMIIPPELGPPVGPSTFFSAKQFEVFDVELLNVKDCQRRTIAFYSDVVCN